ncbi:MAG TPA: HDIG domain-containing protein [Gemmatimonadaceae bacterium]|nr:HDIG domain-containing protein [Gemmatimonadaceae bacterium]
MTNPDLRPRLEGADEVAEPPRPPSRLAFHGVRVGLLLALAGVTYAFFPASPAVESPIFEVGSVATQTVIAPFAYTVRKSDQELQRERDELAGSAKPVLTYSGAGADTAERQLRAFAQAVGNAARTRDVTAIQRAASGTGISLSPAEAEYLGFEGRRRNMVDGVRRVYSRWLTQGVAANGAIDDVRGEAIVRRGNEERNVLADSILTFSSMLARASRMHPDPNSSVGDALFLKMLSAFFHPTVSVDRAATERRRQELRNSVDATRYIVRQGEKIVGAHEVVGKAEFDKLRALHEELQSRTVGERKVGRVLGAILYNALVLAIFGVAIVLFRPQLYESIRSLALFALLFTTVLAGAAIAARTSEVYPEVVPVALAAIILSVIFDPRISMIAAMILAVLVGGQGLFRGTNALFINLVGGAAAALSMRVIRRRDQAYYSVLIVAGAYLFAAVALGLTLGWTAQQIALSSLRGGVNALVSVVLAMFLLPLAERLTGTTTDLTLLEYSDLNRPLLRRLMLEAPGTYAHTMRMASLAEAAANAIGANGLLARVGTYYHDIGKLAKPQYFVENQPRGRNPHDKLKPNTSAAIVRNHVREGVELAEENHLPKAIASFIKEHHGTGPISYFLDKARERDGSVPNTAEFAYPGPVPQSPETAIAMLADGVEAASRVLPDPSPERIREVIDHIVRQRMEQGQLRDAPLTLQQLDRVKEEFVRVLGGMNHNRIDYPASSGGITAEFATYDSRG